MAALGGASATGLAGCSTGSSDPASSSSGDAEKAAIERFVAAVNEDDVETATASVSEWAAGGFTESTIGEYTLDYGTLTRLDQSRAVVGDAAFQTQLTISHGEETRTEETVFGVSGSESDRYIVRIDATGGLIVGGTLLGLPSAFLESTYDPSATSDADTGVLTLSHTGGGTMPADSVYVSGSIVDPAGADVDVSTDGAALSESTAYTRFAPGDDFTVGVNGDYTVSVSYEKESAGTAIIDEFSRS
ncbi:hypothetical protein GCM10009037_20640 [Halarchaeum grantii]|uniref:Uncharacterized protein n=2 Tax=Halarchaeum grantii TaxID=1193105 RepID=A0A830EWI7_9EURY|nr:hypothetical protein GCM10009037_20640 [Halarchaeum grantii]